MVTQKDLLLSGGRYNITGKRVSSLVLGKIQKGVIREKNGIVYRNVPGAILFLNLQGLMSKEANPDNSLSCG